MIGHDIITEAPLQAEWTEGTAVSFLIVQVCDPNFVLS